MGCRQSKEVIDPERPQTPANPVADSITSTSNVTARASAVTLSPPSPRQRAHEWAVRPGYSSGASSMGSLNDNDDDEFLESDDGLAELMAEFPAPRDANAESFSSSRHSDILGLSTLRQKIISDGDLTKTVVRIETPFDTPIEEIYSGVLDGPILGSGVSGIVRLVEHRTTGVKYAVKCLDLGLVYTDIGLRQLRDEIFIMCQLDHPNIVRIEEVYESANEIYIVQELCRGGDLFDRLDEQPDYHYTEVQCARLVKQMLSSVRYLHSKGIIHRDLKLENFLFSSTEANSELKMIDFGLSKHFEIGDVQCERVGTPYTVAPEIIKGSYDEKSDMWALGVITYLLLSGETPFGGLDGEEPLEVRDNIMRGHLAFDPPDIWGAVSKEGKAFVRTLLNPDAAARPNAKEMQRNDWIQVFAKKDAAEGKQLNSRTVSALISFKESSDMQKLLSEVLSFTLLPEQIVDLRSEFEKMDSDGAGEISLSSLKEVLLQNAEAGALGALTEQEVEDLFDSIRVRKSEPTIRWHEFLAAGLSQARVDDRNLRLAFDRLDAQRKGYLTFKDLVEMLGNSAGALEKIWRESMDPGCQAADQVNFDDFKKLMKGQSNEKLQHPQSPLIPPVPKPTRLHSITSGVCLEQLQLPLGELNESKQQDENLPVSPRAIYSKTRSVSYEHKKSNPWTDLSESSSGPLNRPAVNENTDNDASPLVVNRALYRKHREMRLAVLEASKQFDVKRNKMIERSTLRASLVMKRGGVLEDAVKIPGYDEVVKRCGRARRAKNKTVSDMTGMLI